MRSTRILINLMLAAYLALVSASGRDAVVCVGPDGHLAVELGCFGDLCSSTETPGTGVTSGQCGACVDTPLLIDAARAAVVQSGRSASGMALAALVACEPLSVQLSGVTTPTFYRTQPSGLPAVLRTTVLLI